MTEGDLNASYLNMTSYTNTSNIRPLNERQNVHFNMQTMQNFPNPNCSPMSGYYPGSSQSPSQTMPPPVLQSTINQGPDTMRK